MNRKVKLVPTKNVTEACCNCLYGGDEIYAGWCDKHCFTICEDDFYGCRCLDWKDRDDE